MDEKEKNALLGAKRKGLTGAALKWAAVVTMFIDHATDMVYITWLLPVRNAARIYPIFTLRERAVYTLLRGVGRLAFPVYCFLLVEGFLHTRDVRKYLGRMLLFGLLSELPFDYALFGYYTRDYQNVYFTLFLGLLGIWCISYIAAADFWEQTRSVQLGRFLGCAAAAAGCMAAAAMLKTDYSWGGVGVILAFYCLRRKPLPRDLAAGGALLTAGITELAALPGFLLIHFYNGERGRQPKYFFYLFYPAHLVLLWLTRVLIAGF